MAAGRSRDNDIAARRREWVGRVGYCREELGGCGGCASDRSCLSTKSSQFACETVDLKERVLAHTAVA